MQAIRENKPEILNCNVEDAAHVAMVEQWEIYHSERVKIKLVG